jgi:hypothetical protein
MAKPTIALIRATVLAAAAIAIGLMFSTATLAAGSRGVTVKLKASEAVNAADAGEVRLYESSHALVIGIDAYRDRAWPHLSRAVSDAQAVAKVLEAQGFEVTLKTDLDSVGLSRTLKDFFIRKGRDANSRLFVWFAGHGHTLNGEGFLIPSDGVSPSDEIGFLSSAVSLRDFGKFVRYAKSKHAYAVFDSCFAGTVFNVARSRTPPAITRVTTEPVRQFLSSGDAGQKVSDDGRFARMFVEALEGRRRADANADGYLTASEIGAYLTYQLTNLSNNVQTPRYGKLMSDQFDRGDFVFVLPGGAAAVRAAPGGGGTAAQMVFWKSMEGSTSGGDYCAYLETFPKGTFAALARSRAKQYGGACAAEKQTASLMQPTFSIRDMDGLYVAVKRANVRAKPDATGPKLTTLDVGATVSVTGRVEGKDWYRIALADGTGFVWSPLLEDREAYERRQEAERERLRVARLAQEKAEQERRLRVAEEARKRAEEEQSKTDSITGMFVGSDPGYSREKSFVRGSCADAAIPVDEAGEVDWLGYVRTLRDGVPVYSSPDSRKAKTTLAFGRIFEVLAVENGRLEVQSLASSSGLGWVADRDLLCREKPLRGKSGLESKLYIRTETRPREEEPRTVKAYPSPRGKTCGNKCRELLRSKGYFIFAIDDTVERYLLADNYSLEEGTSLVGWVDRQDGFIWDTAYGIRPREDLVFSKKHPRSGQERPACIYPSIVDAEAERNCWAVAGGDGWLKSPERILVLGRDEQYLRVLAPLRGTDGIVYTEGFVADDGDFVIDVWLKSDDLTRWINLLDLMRDVREYSPKQQRLALVESLVQTLQSVIGKPQYQDTEESLRDYLQRKGGLPVRDNSPLLNYTLDDLMNPSRVPNCEILRLTTWLHNAKQILAIVNKGDRKPVITTEPYSGKCPGGRDIPIIVGNVKQEKLGDDGMNYSHPFQKSLIYWVPRDFLP